MQASYHAGFTRRIPHPAFAQQSPTEGGDALIGEVSTMNDVETDNVFRDLIGWFTDVEEDAVPLRLLVSDYGAQQSYQ
ncbi:MAG: D-lyxose/D-mannose family sugar isomerase [Litorimonas sp.]